MATKVDLVQQVFTATREYGMASVLLRNAVSRKLALNSKDMECLSLLIIKGIASPTELAHYTGMTTGAATSMLDRLEKAGFITRQPNPKDRRGVIISVKRESMQKVAAVFVGVQTVQSDVINSYSADKLQIIVDFLEQITESINAQVGRL